jgi:hypothetical protein
MRSRRWYQSRLLVLAMTLLVLGAGNAVIGSRKLGQYQAIVAEGRARGYFPDAASSTDRILRPLDDEGERYNIGRAKVDLYHVVLSGGLLMIVVGVVLTIIAWLRLRLSAPTSEHSERAPRFHVA